MLDTMPRKRALGRLKLSVLGQLSSASRLFRRIARRLSFAPPVVTPEQRRDFARDGFLCIDPQVPDRLIERVMSDLGGKHHRRGIPEGLFPEFQDALLTALAQFHGPDWDPALASQWRQALDPAVEVMREGYREPALF